jgi:hypothetical protein
MKVIWTGPACVICGVRERTSPRTTCKWSTSSQRSAGLPLRIEANYDSCGRAVGWTHTDAILRKAAGSSRRPQAGIWRSRPGVRAYFPLPSMKRKTRSRLDRIASPGGKAPALMLAAAAPAPLAPGQASAARCRWSGRESHATVVHDHRLYRAPEHAPSKAPRSLRR